MNTNTKKENTKVRRERLANELMDAYNGGGDYEKVIEQIEGYGDTFSGWMCLKAKGIVSEEPLRIKVSRELPPRLQGGWEGVLTMVDVIHDGVNVPPKFSGNAAFRKNIWR